MYINDNGAHTGLGRLFEVTDLGRGYVRIQLEPDSIEPGSSLVLTYETAMDMFDHVANIVLPHLAAQILGTTDEEVIDRALADLGIQL